MHRPAHPWHLVDASPWPIFTAAALLSAALTVAASSSTSPPSSTIALLSALLRSLGLLAMNGGRLR